MNRKLLIVLLGLFLLAGTAIGQGRKYYHIQFVDEWNEAVTTMTSITVSTSAGGTATLYTTQTGSTEYGSSGVITTGISDGAIEFWYEDTTIDVSATYGSYTRSVNDMSVTTTRIQWPSYLVSTSSTSYADSSTITMGSDSDWVIQGGATANLLQFTPANDDAAVNIGTTNYTSDLNLYGGTSGYNLYWDASENTLEFLDNTVLAIGTGDDWTVSHNGTTTTVTGAYTNSGIVTYSTDVFFDGTYDIQYDDSRYQLLFQDNAVLGLGGAADAAGDVTMWHDGSDFYLDAAIADEGWKIGDTTSGFDITYYFETAGQFRTDYDGDFINLTDDMDLRFGTGASADGDFMISSDSSNLLTIDVVVAGTGEIAVGNDADDVPLKWYGETTGDFVYLTGDDLQLEDISLCLADATQLQFGDPLGTGDIKMYANGTELVIDGVVAETGTVSIGLTDLGIDLKLWAATNAEGVLWDASDEALEFTGANLVLDASSAIKNAVVTVTDAASYTVLAASSGKVHVIADMSQNTSIVLPAEAAGLYYKFIYVGAAADAHDHTIDSESNTNYFIGGVAFADSDAGAGADEIHAGVYSDGNSNSKFTINNIACGTVVEVYCDGTHWYITGTVYSDTVCAFADQS